MHPDSLGVFMMVSGPIDVYPDMDKGEMWEVLTYLAKEVQRSNEYMSTREEW